MIEINSTHQNEMGVDKVSTYLLSLGINLSFFLILFLPSMTRYWGIMLGVINVLYIVINRGSMQKNIYFKSIYSIVLMPLFIIITFSSLSMTTGSNFVEGIKLIFTFSLFFAYKENFDEDALKVLYEDLCKTSAASIVGSGADYSTTNVKRYLNFIQKMI